MTNLAAGDTSVGSTPMYADLALENTAMKDLIAKKL